MPVIPTSFSQLCRELALEVEFLTEASKLATPDNAASRFTAVSVTLRGDSLHDRVNRGLSLLGVHLQKCDGGIRLQSPSFDSEAAHVDWWGTVGDALRTMLATDVLLLDMDGVLADVSGSYREAIVATAAHFCVTISGGNIEAAKAEGNANDDWALTHRLVTQAGKDVSLEAVTEVFEEYYQGTDSTPGLCETETLIVPGVQLERLSKRFRLGIVTGRPRCDAEKFLNLHNLSQYFSVVVSREDAPLKPEPDPVLFALRRLGETSSETSKKNSQGATAWFVGDTPDDILSAVASRTLGIGVVAPGADIESHTELLFRSGAGYVIKDFDELEALLP